MSSEKIRRELGWEPRHTVPDAVRELVAAFKAGKVPNSLTDPRYFNIKTMNAHLAQAAERQAAVNGVRSAQCTADLSVVMANGTTPGTCRGRWMRCCRNRCGHAK